jgi:predicted  nucleic acid-binding Zn-ribbon protein
MSNKDLIVLAECVDKRTGRRFQRGETFDPIPGVEQAKRLIVAGCLSEGAYYLARQAEDDEEKRQDSEFDEALKAAQDADQAVVDAQAALDAAADDAKAGAKKALDEAKATAKAAQTALKKLTK